MKHQNQKEQSNINDFDLLVLGGGITGAGIAREAGLRGLRVLLVDTRDFASATSHASSKLIHGGFRYLEQGQLKMVFESLQERRILLHHVAPHLVRPLRFVFPFRPRQWPFWILVSLGAMLYEGLAAFQNVFHSKLVFSKWLRRHVPLLDDVYQMGVSFGDAQVNDSRLVIDTLLAAERLGVTICNYASVVELSCSTKGYQGCVVWEDGRSMCFGAKTVVNATGPWSFETAKTLGLPRIPQVWVKGSHVVVPKPSGFSNHAMVFSSPLGDDRVVFAIPWENVVLLGTTEVLVDTDPRNVVCSKEEATYLMSIFAHYFPKMGLGLSDIQSAFSGVRPLFGQSGKDMHKMSREHVITVDTARRSISVAGGKLTTYRRMGEQIVDKVQRLLAVPLPKRRIRRQVRRVPLRQGIHIEAQKRLVSELKRKTEMFKVRDEKVFEHLAQTYASDVWSIVSQIAATPELGVVAIEGLPFTLAELRHVAQTEHVVHLADLLKRRTPIFFLAQDSGCPELDKIAGCVAPILRWDKKRLLAEKEAYQQEVAANMAFQMNI